MCLLGALSVEAVHTPAKRGRASRRLDSDVEDEADLIETAQKPVAAPLRRSCRHVQVPTKFGDTWPPALLTSCAARTIDFLCSRRRVRY